MSDDNTNDVPLDDQLPDGNQGGQPDQDKSDNPDTITQRIKHNQISARVPEQVASGTFSTGAIVLQGPNEFVIEYLLSLTRPHQVAARVIVPQAVVPQMMTALRDNISKFENRFGDIPKLPKPPEQKRKPTIEEIYEELRLPDERLAGVYANAVLIGHSASEFNFDFIANFFPRSAVSARIYMSAPHVPRLLDTLERSYQQFQQRVIEQRAKLRQAMQAKAAQQRQAQTAQSTDDPSTPPTETSSTDDVPPGEPHDDHDSGDTAGDKKS